MTDADLIERARERALILVDYFAHSSSGAYDDALELAYAAAMVRVMVTRDTRFTSSERHDSVVGISEIESRAQAEATAYLRSAGRLVESS